MKVSSLRGKSWHIWADMANELLNTEDLTSAQKVWLLKLLAKYAFRFMKSS